MKLGFSFLTFSVLENDMSPKWLHVGTAAVIALAIILTIEFFVSTALKLVDERKDLVVVFEIVTFSIFICTYMYREIVRLATYLMSATMTRPSKDALEQSLKLETREISIIFGSLVVSVAIYKAFSILN
jgi:hypothetical protein